MGRLDGRVAIVTGAGSVGAGWGNGRATAVLFAREGASVVIADIDDEAARETRRLIEEDGGRCAIRPVAATHSCHPLRSRLPAPEFRGPRHGQM